MKQYKALISDLDGTLVPNSLDGMPSEIVIDAVSKAKKKIHFSIATGRAYWQAKPILDKLNLSGPVILLNGALIIDGQTRKTLLERPLLQKDFDTTIAILKKTTFRFLIDTKERTYESDVDTYPHNPLTILVWDITEEDANILIRHFSHIPTIATYKVSGWTKGKFGLNISHKLATKQHGIFEVAKILKINTHEIIGIGDGPNDFPLLMASGLKVAMGNAAPDLKAIADHITGTVEEDGVAEVIEQFVLKK
jgi:HAD superfamily hydrolase (TIGR01484 family)